jgi:hypothetical protein
MAASAILITILLTGVQLVHMLSRKPRAAAVAAASAISRQSTQPFYSDQCEDAEESVPSRRSQRERIAAEHHDPMAGITAEKQVSCAALARKHLRVLMLNTAERA